MAKDRGREPRREEETRWSRPQVMGWQVEQLPWREAAEFRGYFEGGHPNVSHFPVKGAVWRGTWNRKRRNERIRPVSWRSGETILGALMFQLRPEAPGEVSDGGEHWDLLEKRKGGWRQAAVRGPGTEV